jgi:hypothetical protein
MVITTTIFIITTATATSNTTTVMSTTTTVAATTATSSKTQQSYIKYKLRCRRGERKQHGVRTSTLSVQDRIVHASIVA